jgi:N6-adenosine-specific RNA methylase IME4
MTLALVNCALEEVQGSYDGPWCLPRVYADKKPLNKPGEAQEHGASAGAEEGQQILGQLASDVCVPLESRYLLGSIQSQREALLAAEVSFDLIVLDPPWPNRSARRKKGNYTTVNGGVDEVRELLSLIPVGSRLAQDGLVAVWVTNAHRFTDLLSSPRGVFAAWGLEVVGEWTWLKITTGGEPIYSVESRWRKPWERLLVARRPGSSRSVDSRKVILTVPDIHSRKPNLRGLFEHALGSQYLGLEVFARNLTAGWWSWGDETLYFQHGEHWSEE